ncbi:MAG: hypothetical protein O2955_20565, partial [Planctomycetota bacterium]|nr:hypothetical protein [Planctomycetota bacterium]
QPPSNNLDNPTPVQKLSRTILGSPPPSLSLDVRFSTDSGDNRHGYTLTRHVPLKSPSEGSGFDLTDGIGKLEDR